jgi:plastocyanin
VIVKTARSVSALTTLVALGLGSLLLLGAGGSRALTADAAGAADAANAAEKPASAVEVKIDNFTYVPGAVKVAAGTTVTWVNHDDIPHTVVSTEKVFKSRVLDTDEKFSYAFTKPGRYPYFCSLHPKMTGEVVVQ